MARRRISSAALVVAVLTLSLTGCHQASVRYNTRYAALLSQPLPKILHIPVDGVTRVSNSWGMHRDGGRHHQGIDIFAARNTPIRSITEGVVEFKGMRGLGGQVIYIVGPGGYRHYYAHLEEFGLQAEGDWVEAGEVIGYVGNSGNAAISSTHLHYGLYSPGGRAVNPYTYLRAGEPFMKIAAADQQTIQQAAK
ncbi:MAG TPA: M23 family metallopeptidase [Thermoanaerobaculia bacterium]|nr:M23 family metallopeptidase [Thermoanaerobaculia bacterium]